MASQLEPPVSGFGGWRIGRLAQAILRVSQVFEGVYLATFTVARLGPGMARGRDDDHRSASHFHAANC